MTIESRIASDERRKPSPVAILLGAGASVDAGCPTVRDLVNRFENSLNSDRTRLAAFQMVVENLTKSSVAKGGAMVDIELILSALDDLLHRDRVPLTAFVSSWKADVRRFKTSFSELLGLLQDHIREQCTVNPQKVGYLWPLKEFVDRYGALDVFTLNYDAAVEIVCQQRDITYTDGFDLYWNPGLFQSSMYKLRLFKLHGSLLWHETESVPRKLVKIPVKNPGTGTLQYFTDESVTQVLMYPAFVKNQHVDPYATLVAHLRESLGSAELLIAIGCSFRDEYLKRVVLEKLIENPALQIVVVAPHPVELLRASDALSESSAQFEMFSSRISQIPSSASDALAASHLLDHVRSLGEAQQLLGDAQQAVLAGRDEYAGDMADAYLTAALRARHITEIIRVVQQDPTRGLIRNSLRQRIHAAEPKSTGAFPLIAPAIVLSTLASSPVDRDAAANFLRQSVQWVCQFVFWRTSNGGLKTTTGQATQLGADTPDDFFNVHQARVRALIREFARWTDGLRFGLPPVLSTAVQSFSSDLVVIDQAFEPGATFQWSAVNVGPQTTTGRRTLRVPRTSNNALLDQLGSIFAGDANVPASICELLPWNWQQSDLLRDS